MIDKCTYLELRTHHICKGHCDSKTLIFFNFYNNKNP